MLFKHHHNIIVGRTRKEGIMNNFEIRMKLFENGLKYWQLADKLGISEMTLSRKLRHEMTEEEKNTILEAIQALIEAKGGQPVK